LRPGGIVYVDNARAAADARAINAALPAIAQEYGVLPPLIAVDHEGGNVQRIQDVANLGSNAAFAATQPTDQEACLRGQQHAEQLRAMGFTMNLAPVLDVNNNPANPVIGIRSYGADPALVARLGSAYVRGLQGGGVAAVGKHFPGHGNTGVDSHVQLPTLPQTEADLEQIELVPFRRAIAPETDVAALMSAHIVFPAVDPSGLPATLSYPIITGLLRQRLGFQGLVVSDDLAGMRAITDNFPPGDAAVQAVRAGVDMLIIGGGVPRQRESRDALLAALGTGALSRERLDEAVRHVVVVKARFGLLGDVPAPGPGCA
jgi:beta-N-acetylhexosaminidase